MKGTTKLTSWGMAGVFVTLALMPAAAFAGPGDRQKNKNLWRNLGIAGAVVAGHGLISHNSTETLLGAAGAAYSASRYEKDRHSQDEAKRARERYYHRARTHRYHLRRHR